MEAEFYTQGSSALRKVWLSLLHNYASWTQLPEEIIMYLKATNTLLSPTWTRGQTTAQPQSPTCVILVALSYFSTGSGHPPEVTIHSMKNWLLRQQMKFERYYTGGKYLMVAYWNIFSHWFAQLRKKKKKNHTHKGSQILVLLKFPEHRKRKQDRGQFHTTHLQALSSAEAPSPPLQSTCRGKLFCKDHSDQIMFVRVPETVIYIKFLFLPPPLERWT